MADGDGGQGADPTQEAARLARDYVPECITTLVDVMRRPTRQSPAQVSAAKLLLEVAGQLEAEKEQSGKRDGKLVLVDATKAAAELERRLQGGSR